MALSFVPDGVFLVCTNGIVSQKLFVRSQSTVLLNDGRPMATTYDRMTGDFLCPAMVLAGPAIAGLAATVFAGTMVAALAITTVSSIALARITGIIPCFCGMLTTAWFPFHFVAQGNGLFPILESSKLSCTLGGTVTIAFTQAKADALVSYNRNKFALDVAEGLSYLLGIGAIVKGLKTVRASIAFLRKTALSRELGKKIADKLWKGFALDVTYDIVKSFEINDLSIQKIMDGGLFDQEGIDKDVIHGLKNITNDESLLHEIGGATIDQVPDFLENINEVSEHLQKVDVIPDKKSILDTAKNLKDDVGKPLLKKIFDDLLEADNLFLTGYTYAVQQADKIEEQMEKRRIGAIEEKL
jgi:hypothetical protein